MARQDEDFSGLPDRVRDRVAEHREVTPERVRPVLDHLLAEDVPPGIGCGHDREEPPVLHQGVAVRGVTSRSIPVRVSAEVMVPAGLITPLGVYTSRPAHVHHLAVSRVGQDAHAAAPNLTVGRCDTPRSGADCGP